MKSLSQIARNAFFGACLFLLIVQSAHAITGTVQLRTGLEPAAVCETTATSTVSVTLEVADLVDALGVNGVQVRLSYDNSVLALNSGSTTELSGFTRIYLADSAGLVTYAIVNNGGSVGPGVGPFSVATLVFDVMGEGNTAVTFQADSSPFVTSLTTAEQNPQFITGANLIKTPSGAISIDDTTATASSNSPVCEGDSLTLDGGTTGTLPNSPYSFSWSGPDGFSSNDEDPEVSASATSAMAGTYTLTVTNAQGCTFQAMTEVVVNANPACSITTASPVCSGSNNTADGPAGMTTYVWSVIGGSLDMGQGTSQISYTAGAGPTVTIDLTVTDANGCSSSCQEIVTVETAPTADAGMDQTICSGSDVTLDGTCGGATGSLWSSIGDGTFGDDSMEDTTYTPGAADLLAGTVTLTLTCSGNACPAAMDSLVVTIESAPTADAGMDQTICSGSDVTLDGTCGGATGSLWTSSGDGAFGDNSLEDTTYTPGAADLLAGTVTLTLTCNGNACPAAMDSLVVTIQGCVTVNLEVPGLLGDAAEGEHVADRSVQFDLTTCPGTVDSRTQTVEFKRTGLNGTATVILANPNPSATWLSVVEGHTLRRRVPIDLSINGSDVVTVSLISGDLQTSTVPQDALVDIVDFSILASRWNTVVSDCVGGDPEDCSLGADVTGDGEQDTVDFTAIQIYFFSVGDDVSNCGVISPPAGPKKKDGGIAVATVSVPVPIRRGATGLPGRTSISVGELTTLDARAALADVNGDGTVDASDIRLFARQQGLPILESFDQKLKAIEASNFEQGN
ncbi:MAG: hypothetical protein HS101_15520 [Planctomycetia bacterium]|nr:hypothetical protein [Planctomycetia bacterium]